MANDPTNPSNTIKSVLNSAAGETVSPLSKAFTFLKENFKNLIVAFLHVMPEALLAGAILIGLATQNIPYLMLGLAMLVFKFSSKLIGGFLKSRLAEPLFKGATETNDAICSIDMPTLTKYSNLTADLRSSAIPATNIFFVVAVIFYCVNNIYKFQDELNAQKRDDVLPVSAIFGSLIILIYLIWLMKEGCNSKEVILVTSLFAAGVAYLVSFAFERIFGRQGINLLGIPLLVDQKLDTNGNIISCS